MINRNGVVVICLKNRTFVVSTTTFQLIHALHLYVVICLKNRTFVVSTTTDTITKKIQELL